VAPPVQANALLRTKHGFAEFAERRITPAAWGETARRTAVATLVVIGLVAVALALWKLKLIVSLLFLGFAIAAAMRPGVEWRSSRASTGASATFPPARASCTPR
jgi:hypothetical protein